MHAEQFAEQFNNSGLHPHEYGDSLLLCTSALTEFEANLAIHLLIAAGYRRATVDGELVRLDKTMEATEAQKSLNT